MKPSQKAFEIIKHFEGLRLKAYRDGGGVLTIGWGHTGPDVRVDMEITRARAEQLLENDVARACQIIDTWAGGYYMSQGQFDALVSFVFNVGAKQFRASTLLRRLRTGQFKLAAAEFDKWVWDNGKVFDGLVRRRAAERRLFESGEWDADKTS